MDRPENETGKRGKGSMKKKKFPVFSLVILGLIILGCLFGKLLATGDPFYMNLTEVSLPPGGAHYFGTDTMGRDIYSMIWEGGRVSLYIGILATVISSGIAIVYGCVSGLVPDPLDDLLMRFTEIILSIPSILLVIFLQALLGKATATSIAVVIGLTSWMNISKVIRSEVRQIRSSDFVLASRLAGGKFFYILRKHLFPNFISSTMFMIVTNVSAAIGTEATLSFLGIGLPMEIISWGSMMSLSQKALLSNSWWIILIPGIFLVTTLVCITNVGEYIRLRNNREHSNL
ncbi:ABC transporter permease [Blautia producta]|uniref:ABC transporter permease n=3 Tax=Blautia producta TaxID=33035 RepID=A0A7G5MW57_9FIRM|nr:ABC transporter permease [Blautia producta ATCC 27340 = DSM 2950]QMW78850.1 ABC transporter permease [Blautia producta]